jgi:hypothetical protein
MLFGQPIDSLIEITCRAFAKLTGWSPIGKRVALRVTEGEQGFFGTVVTGVVDRFERGVFSDQENVSVGALIRLDAPWTTRDPSKAFAWVFAVPRFSGHSVWRLPLSSADVNVFPATEKGLDEHVAWDDMIAICDMQLRSSEP